MGYRVRNLRRSFSSERDPTDDDMITPAIVSALSGPGEEPTEGNVSNFCSFQKSQALSWFKDAILRVVRV